MSSHLRDTGLPNREFQRAAAAAEPAWTEKLRRFAALTRSDSQGSCFVAPGRLWFNPARMRKNFRMPPSGVCEEVNFCRCDSEMKISKVPTNYAIFQPYYWHTKSFLGMPA